MTNTPDGFQTLAIQRDNGLITVTLNRPEVRNAIDLQMVREAAFGVAMANADARLLALADHVAPHHAEDGFADLVTRLLDGALPLPAVASHA